MVTQRTKEGSNVFSDTYEVRTITARQRILLIESQAVDGALVDEQLPKPKSRQYQSHLFRV